MTRRRNVSSGSPFESLIGFSRAVRVGPHVFLAGTAPIWPDGSCPDGVEAQARRCWAVAATALAGAGAGLQDVVRTRTYVTSADDFVAARDVHREIFGAIRPAATMIAVAGMLDSRWRIEIEAEAIVTTTWARRIRRPASPERAGSRQGSAPDGG